MEKNLKSNINGAVDEELLRGFFAHSMRMHIADGGFSRRVMRNLPCEVPVRQRVAYLVWSLACVVACVVAFFLSDGIAVLGRCARGVAASVASSIGGSMPHLQIETLVPHVEMSPTTPIMVVLTLTVLACVALYDVVESR